MHQRNIRSAASLLGLWHLHDDTIITTQGVYLRGMSIRGLDSEHLASDVLMLAAEQLYEGMKTEVPDETLLQFVVTAHGNYDDVFSRFEALPTSSNPVLRLQRNRRLDF